MKKIIIIVIVASFIVGIVMGYVTGRYRYIKNEKTSQYVCEIYDNGAKQATYWVDPLNNDFPEYYTTLRYKADFPLKSNPEKHEIQCSRYVR